MTHYLLLQFEPGFFEQAHIYELAQSTFTQLRDADIGILDVEVEKNCVDRPSNADLLVRMTLSGRDALTGYINHPLHLQFIKTICEHERSRLTFDCE